MQKVLQFSKFWCIISLPTGNKIERNKTMNNLTIFPAKDGLAVRFFGKYTVSYTNRGGKVSTLHGCHVEGGRLYAKKHYKVENGRQYYTTVIIDLLEDTVQEITRRLAIINA